MIRKNSLKYNYEEYKIFQIDTDDWSCIEMKHLKTATSIKDFKSQHSRSIERKM